MSLERRKRGNRQLLRLHMTGGVRRGFTYRWEILAVPQFLFFTYVVILIAAHGLYLRWHVVATIMIALVSTIVALTCVGPSLSRLMVMLLYAVGTMAAMGALLRGTDMGALGCALLVLAVSVSTTLLSRRWLAPVGCVSKFVLHQLSFVLPVLAGCATQTSWLTVPSGALANIYIGAFGGWGYYIGVRAGRVGPWETAAPGVALSLLMTAGGWIWIAVANLQ